MKYEKINKNYTKTIIIGLTAIIIIGSVLVLNITKAKYKTTVSVPIVSGTINYSGGYDFKVMALYQHKDDKNCTGEECYDPINEMPGSDYEINTTESYCTLDGQEEHDKLYTNENGEHIINKLKKNEKCYLYFDKKRTSKVIVDDLNKTAKEGSTVFTTVETADNSGIMYKGTDDLGDTYYFRGKVEDNWVKFGKTGTDGSTGEDIWWRIIRINGDGSIRLIYAGTSNGTAPATTGTTTQITIDTPSRSPNDYYYATQNGASANKNYVGYYYTLDEKRGLSTKSFAAEKLDSWFEQNLLDEWANGNGLIDKNATFCADRSSAATNTTWTEDLLEDNGLYQVGTSYGAFLRMGYYSKFRYPIFKCGTIVGKEKDTFSYTEAKSGNNVLQYPIGLITADEAIFAGGLDNGNNSEYYLYTKQLFWTMSPSYFQQGYNEPFVFGIRDNGSIDSIRLVGALGLRPVICLTPKTQFTGTGISTDPFIAS